MMGEFSETREYWCSLKMYLYSKEKLLNEKCNNLLQLDLSIEYFEYFFLASYNVFVTCLQDITVLVSLWIYTRNHYVIEPLK